MLARYLSPLIIAVAVAIALLLDVAGVSAPISRAVDALGYVARERSASGNLAVVEMDAASVAAIDRWPWSRVHYATVIDRLRAAGARSIVFDVDFSTPSDPASDAALAEAIRRARGTVVLPTFAQPAGHNDRRSIDALPTGTLREDAALAAVSVDPDKDGLVRRMLLGTITAGTPRPSLSAYIAHRSGTADAQFPIDFAIDPGTIPRLSFIDAERGHIAPGSLRGKDVLIGATAIEIGDRYAVPRYGVLPGVIVQALATETLARGVPRSMGGMPALALGILTALFVLRSGAIQDAVARGALGVVLTLALYALGWRTGWVFDAAPGLIVIAIVVAARIAILTLLEMKHRRMHDPATGLPNRHALARDTIEGGDALVVAAVLQNYDRVAAVLGEAEVAHLIERVAQRLLLAAGNAQLYRTDDRVLAWSTSVGRDELDQALAGAAQLMRVPIETAGRRIDVNVVFGIASTLAEATLAANEAVECRTSWHYHAAAERELLDRDISLMGELDDAIKRHELIVLYQPKLDLDTNAVTSAEALVRWQHPTRGFLAPDAFIPMAERNNRIEDLTLYVLDRAIADLTNWARLGEDIRVAVNISARLIASTAFGAAVHEMLEAMTVAPDRLIFEVTESATLDQPEAASSALHAFSAMGVTISMDDYGTGQSTLSYLRQLPLGELKIDRSFVQHAHENRADAVLVRSTIDLAHELSIRVVAEGVEDEECLTFLRSVGCDYAQGYHIGKPMPADDLLDLSRREQRRAA